MRIYVAGKFSSDNVLGVLSNIREGVRFCAHLLQLGHEPFCPWLDHQYNFYTDKLKVEDYYRGSMAWLEVSEEVWVLPGWENSNGTKKEIERAKELGIPVRYVEEK
jgi:hypothetical protein